MWKILVADDEAMERSILKEILEDNIPDVTVRTAADGQAAAELAALWQPHLALLDIEMPVLTGIAAAGKIRQSLPHCEMIFLTAYGRFDYAQEALRLRVYDYLLKPAEDADVIRAVLSGLEKAAKHTPRLPEPEPATEEPAPTDKNSKLLLQVQSYLDNNYEKEISLDALAETLSFSPFYLSKLFKQTFGKSFIDYLTDVRIAAAKDLLANSLLSAKEVGEHVGYPNSNYFTKLFKRKTGFTPIEYRNQL